MLTCIYHCAKLLLLAVKFRIYPPAEKFRACLSLQFCNTAFFPQTASRLKKLPCRPVFPFLFLSHIHRSQNVPAPDVLREFLRCEARNKRFWRDENLWEGRKFRESLPSSLLADFDLFERFRRTGLPLFSRALRRYECARCKQTRDHHLYVTIRQLN